MDRPQVRRDVAAVVAQRIEEAPRDVVQRHVVIAGHDQLGTGQGVEECPCLAELPTSRPLGEVARNGHELGIDVADDRENGCDDRGIGAPEVHI